MRAFGAQVLNLSVKTLPFSEIGAENVERHRRKETKDENCLLRAKSHLENVEGAKVLKKELDDSERQDKKEGRVFFF